MLKNRKWLSAAAGVGLVALLGAPALSVGALTTSISAERTFIRPPAVRPTALENAAITFVNALSARDASTVWMFASEEEQDAFATEEATYEAYADAFPALVKGGTLRLQRSWNEGDTPFVEFVLASPAGHQYRLTMGLWLDDANDWKVVSCDLVALSDRVAGL